MPPKLAAPHTARAHQNARKRQSPGAFLSTSPGFIGCAAAACIPRAYDFDGLGSPQHVLGLLEFAAYDLLGAGPAGEQVRQDEAAAIGARAAFSRTIA